MSLNDALITVSQYAKLYNITPQAIRKAISEKRIYAEKVGNSWLIQRPNMWNNKTKQRIFLSKTVSLDFLDDDSAIWNTM